MDGDWNLAGCRWNDPSRLKTVQDVVDLIHKVGFLSLFSVEIPGMSVEEHVPASTWWTDDENTTHPAYGGRITKQTRGENFPRT